MYIRTLVSLFPEFNFDRMILLFGMWTIIKHNLIVSMNVDESFRFNGENFFSIVIQLFHFLYQKTITDSMGENEVNFVFRAIIFIRIPDIWYPLLSRPSFIVHGKQDTKLH